MESFDLRRLKDFEEENTRLKNDVCCSGHGPSDTLVFILKKGWVLLQKKS